MTETKDQTPDRRKATLQLLQWNVLLGADEIIPPEPRPRAPLAEQQPSPQKAAADPPQPGPAQTRQAPTRQDGNPQRSRPRKASAPDLDVAIQQAETLAAAAHDLESLAEAIGRFEHCTFRPEATNMVFADGNPKAWVMLLGEAPGQEEDRAGKPFVGKSGRLIDAMYGEIGLARTGEQAATSLYITNVVNWRPEGNRQPTEAEIAMFKPFVVKHIALAAPRILVLHGNPACRAILGRDGITRLRGTWVTHGALPVLPMFHPAYLLRNPNIKPVVWNDLLMLKSKLRELSHE